MILITLLTLLLFVLAVVAVFAVSIGGSAMIIVFGDVFVCMFIIGLIIRKLILRRKR